MNQTEEKLAPVPPHERIRELDMLRGFALLGVIIVNSHMFNDTLLSFYYHSSNPFNFESVGDQAVALAIQVFATGKFYSLFSLLFGLGFYMFIERAIEKGYQAAPLYRRRLVILLFIGVAHMVFFWYGDILFSYAITGFLLMFFRQKTPAQLKKWIIGLLAFSVLFLAGITTIQEIGMQSAGPEELAAVEAMVQESIQVYQQEDYIVTLRYRLSNEIPMVMASYLFWIPKVLALFLIGLAIGKKGIMKNLDAHRESIRRVFIRSALVGWPLTLLYVMLDSGVIHMPPVPGVFIAEAAREITTVALCFFYAAGVLQLLQNRAWLERFEAFEVVGRMALTNYLFQSVFFSMFYYGYGVGMMHQMPLWQTTVLTFGFFMLQVFISRAYLERHSHGLIEQLWRQYTYKGMKPL